MTTSAAIYVRQSLDRSGEGAAVDRQERECRTLADAHGWTVTQIYRDNDVSASSGPRPGYTALLEDLRGGQHEVVIVWHTDRLYRRLRDLVDLVEIAEKQALRIAAVKAGDVDLSTPSGRMVAGMLGSAARFEVERKGERQKAANRQRAAKGAASWTRRPFGFDRQGHEVILVEDEARAIRDAAAQVIDGASLSSICRAFNEAGTVTSTGAAWSTTTLKRVLTSPRLIGRVTYNGEDMGRLAPAILTEGTYGQVVGILTDPGRRRQASTRVKHLLSGIVACSDCECPMYSGTNNGVKVYRCLACHRVRRLDRVDEVVEAVIVARLSMPDAAELLTAKDDVDLTAVRAHAVELRERRDSIAALVGEGLIGAQAAREQAEKLRALIAQAETRIAAAQDEGTRCLEQIVNATDAAAAWEAATLEQKRRIIRAMLQVEILPAGKGKRFDPEDLNIEWKA